MKVKRIKSLIQGSSADIEIIYPNIGGSIVLGWKEQSVEIISGTDIVAVADFTITGLKSGIALIRVSATTIISDNAYELGYKEKVYFTEIEVEVK